MKKIYLPILITFLALIDQWSKWWVMEVFYKPRVFESEGATLNFIDWLLTFGQNKFPPTSIEVTSFFNMVMVWNKGVSFGMFASYDELMPYVLSSVAIVMALFLGVWMIRAKHLSVLIPLAMVIAGALANVWDRLRFGAVADFFDFHWGDWHYPAFNIADCCIVVGVIALAVDGLFLEKHRSNKKEVNDA